MLDHFNDIARASASAMPLVALSVGALGSLHCAGMCGPLIVASSRGVKAQASYQAGRLISYLSLGLASGFLGQWFLWQQETPLLTLIPSILMALALIFWGTNFLTKKKLAPSFIVKLYRKLPVRGPFFIGLFSILLPCGFLYGVALTVATFQNPWLGSLAMGSFWLGTLPALSGSSWLVSKLANGQNVVRERALGISLIGLGLMSIGYRFYQFATTGSCH